MQTASFESPATSSPRAVLQQAQQACLRIPPLWPLQSFVAVNPFVGLVDRPFEDVADLISKVSHSSMLMTADYYAKQHADGRITVQDLASTVQQSQPEWKKTQVMNEVRQLIDAVNHPSTKDALVLHSAMDLATQLSETPWRQMVVEEVSKWCASYFDHGQSSWRMPWQKQPLYLAWKQAASIDANPELLGLKGFRQTVAALPVTSSAALAELIEDLNIPEACLGDYFHRLLMTIPGWSSYVQYVVREKARNGHEGESMLDLLTILLVFESACLKQGGATCKHAFQTQLSAYAEADVNTALKPLLMWQKALEIGFQRQLCADLVEAVKPVTKSPQPRPALQAVFCIDVRSEVMRRSLESVSDEIQTLGFAGFFGMPIEHLPLGHRKGLSQVPVLLSPKYKIREYLSDATPEQEVQELQKLQLHRRLGHAWSAFKNSAVSCFSFVESVGLGYAWQMAKHSFPSYTMKQEEPGSCDCKMTLLPNLLDDSASKQDRYGVTGISLSDQIQLAYGALKNMGLTSNFAPLVLVCGHGSHTTNNPYAAGLDCGACGGHAGDVNARLAAAILNRAAVRQGLQEHGIHIPTDVHFMAAIHNTTTDVITLFEKAAAPRSHQAALLQAELWVESASQKCRADRAHSLGLANAEADVLKSLIVHRSQDWSQVRPEWGLAGNAAFIAAPRERTQHLNLKGRVFLHNYSPEADPQKSTLELIMTAPMVVANWINLQYYASTVNNRLWGSGNKVTHNVVGTFGVQQGNGGDLQTGLPLQSVHNGQDWVHEPLRLSVIIEATRSDVSAVLQKHAHVRHLAEHEWLHLFVIEDSGKAIYQYRQQAWELTAS